MRKEGILSARGILSRGGTGERGLGRGWGVGNGLRRVAVWVGSSVGLCLDFIPAVRLFYRVLLEVACFRTREEERNFYSDFFLFGKDPLNRRGRNGAELYSVGGGSAEGERNPRELHSLHLFHSLLIGNK